MRLEALLQISDTIVGTRDLKELFRLLAPTLRQAVDFDYIAVFLYDPEIDMLRLQLVETFSDEPFPTSSIPSVTMETAPAGRCFLTQQSVVVDDVDTAAGIPEQLRAIMQKFNVKSSCFQPLTTSLRQLGTISFGSLQQRRFSETDMPFMRRVANHVAVAIDNALHFDESQRYQETLSQERDRLRILLEVNNSSRLELHDFREAVSRSLQRIISHEVVAIAFYEPMPAKGTIVGRVLTTRKPLTFRTSRMTTYLLS
jgi:formate hydrogenlyase transcriptional activator